MTRDEAARLEEGTLVMVFLGSHVIHRATARKVVNRNPSMVAKFVAMGVPYEPNPPDYDPDDPVTGSHRDVRVHDEHGGLRRMTREEIRLETSRHAEVCLIEYEAGGIVGQVECEHVHVEAM